MAIKEKNMIFGLRAIIEAIDSGKEIDKILIRRELQGDIAKELYAHLEGKDIHVQKVPMEKLNRLTMKNHQGAIAFVSAITYQKIEQIIPFLYEQGKDPFIVVLDGLTDVRNFGAIARTCEVAGVDAIVIPSRDSVSANADAVKTSAGALMKIPVCKEANLTDAIQFLKNSGVRILAASERGAVNYTQASFAGPVAIVMGSEERGVSPENLRVVDQMVKIPQFGTIESLNVSVAAGVLIYEAIRQRENL